MKYKLIEIEWVDIVDNLLGWDKLENTIKNSHLDTCFTAGYLLYKDKQKVVVTNSWSEDETSSTVTIPTGCIKRIRRLR